MLHFLPPCLRGSIAIIFYVLNCLICCLYVFSLAPFKLLPIKLVQKRVKKLYYHIPTLWTALSHFTIKILIPTAWDICLDPKINKHESYVLIANHRSWFDIIALQKAIGNVIPPPVYFMKRALLWLPLLGWACWLLGFPFMRRYSKEYVMKHPQKRGKDLDTMRRSCRRYRGMPVTLINYIEGTRFTIEKRAQQHSPYKNLLKPRSGGLAFTLHAMGTQVKHILNVTIFYGTRAYSMWDLLCGRADKITVKVHMFAITPCLRGNYQADKMYRELFQAWLNKLWQQKDAVITDLTINTVKSLKHR